MARSPHVIVVGSGVVGAASAYYLAAAGANVTVVDRGDLGGGTSSRCDGNVLLIDKDTGFDSVLGAKSQELLHDLQARLGPMEYRRPGSYLVLGGEDEVEPAKAWVEQHRAEGHPFAYLDRDAIHRALHDVAPDVPGGVYCASDATLNPLLYVAELLAASREMGAHLLPRTPVEEVLVGSSRVRGVRLATGEELTADAVVVAAGVWSPSLVADLGIHLPIRPRKGTLLVSARGRLFGHVKVMEFGYLMTKFGKERQASPEENAYGIALVYEPTASGNFLLGSSREFVGYDTTPDAHVVRLIARRAMRFYPEMREASIIRSYAGLRPWTPDHLPVVSRTSVEGLVLAAGHEGDGIGLAAVSGALVRDLVLDLPPVVDPTPLDVARFAKTDKEGAL